MNAYKVTHPIALTFLQNKAASRFGAVILREKPNDQMLKDIHTKNKRLLRGFLLNLSKTNKPINRCMENAMIKSVEIRFNMSSAPNI